MSTVLVLSLLILLVAGLCFAASLLSHLGQPPAAIVTTQVIILLIGIWLFLQIVGVLPSLAEWRWSREAPYGDRRL